MWKQHASVLSPICVVRFKASTFASANINNLRYKHRDAAVSYFSVITDAQDRLHTSPLKKKT
jgi:hypothetical protein